MVVHAYYPASETRVERQARALVARGFEVDVICLRNQGEPAMESDGGIAIYRLPVQRHKKRSVVLQLFEYLVFFALAFVRLTVLHWQRRYSVVQVHNLPDFLIFAALAPKLMGASLILDLHDLMPEFYAARFDSDIASWAVRLVAWQESLSCRFADHVITVTELWQQTLIKRGLPPEKVSVVMNVADDRVFQPAAKDGERVVRGDDRFHLIYHGNLTQRYGLDLVIQAVDRVRREIPQIHLTIHGGGDYRQLLLELVNELDLGNHVSFSARFVPTSKLPEFISQADVGIVPYRQDVFTDGILPTKLMEYVALGIPVIAARTSAIAAYFDETMIQFFTPDDPDDLARCIQMLYADPERLAQLARNAELFNQRYNWMNLSAEYVALVERIGGQ